MFSGRFLRFAATEQAVSSAGQPCGWDRILSCVGTDSIPVSGGQLQRGAPGKSSRAIFAFCSPRPPLRSFTKENGAFGLRKWGFWVNALRENAFDSGERSKKLLVGKNDPSGTASPCRRVVADFLRSQLRRIGLGHPLGRDPSRTSMPAIRTNPASGIGHQTGQRNLFGTLQRWPFARCVSSTP